MARQRSVFSRFWALLKQPSAPRKLPARRRGRVLRLERLEDRTVPSVTLLPDGSKFIVSFTGDAAPDTLVLRANNAGQLEYQFYQFNNVTPFSTDLDTTTPGVQAKPLSALSKIVVSLDGGEDSLTVDASTNPDVIPATAGIEFTAGTGTDTLAVTQDADFTLTPTSLTIVAAAGNRTISFTGVEQASLTGGNANNTLDASGKTVTLYGGAIGP